MQFIVWVCRLKHRFAWAGFIIARRLFLRKYLGSVQLTLPWGYDKVRTKEKVRENGIGEIENTGNTGKTGLQRDS